MRSWLARMSGHKIGKRRRADFTFTGLARTIGIHVVDLYRFRDGVRGLTERRLRLLSKFIQDFGNGLVSFDNQRPAQLVHHAVPRHPPTVFRVVAGRLVVQPRPPLAARMPQPKDLFGLTDKRK